MEDQVSNKEKEMTSAEKVSWLATLGWPDEDIARYLGLSSDEFQKRVADKSDELYDSVVGAGNQGRPFCRRRGC